MVINKKTWITSLSGFQYGYNTSIIAAALLFLTTFYSLNPMQQGFLVSMVLLGSVFGSLFAGSWANSLGRKGTNILGAVLFICGVVLSTFTYSYLMLLAGRFIVGVAAAIAITVPPIYLIEISSAEERGATANMNQFGMALGSMIAYFVGYFLAASGNWRWMLGLGLLPAVVQVVGLCFLPESPYKAGLVEERRSSMWKGFLAEGYRSRFLLGLVLYASQSLIGASVIFYFAPLILESAGIEDHKNALLLTVYIGVAYLAGVICSSFAADRLGRRFLMMSSVIGMTMSLGVIILSFHFNREILSFLMIPSLVFFVFSYALGVGPIPSLIVGEMTPTWLRGHALAFTGMVGLLLNYLVLLTCPMLLEAVGLGLTFAFYLGSGLLILEFLYRRLPETKGKTLEEIDQLFI